MNSIHKELPPRTVAKSIRQGVIAPLDELDKEWESSLNKHERLFHPHPEQDQSVWDRVWNLGRDATRERMFA